KWLVWDGVRWKPCSDTAIQALVKKTLRRMYEEAFSMPEEQGKELLRWALTSERQSIRKATASLARSEPGIPILHDELDKDPWLLTVNNGTINLRTGELLTHRREDLITKLAPVHYNSGAQCSTWLAFLDRILAGDVTLIEFLQRAVGYSLTGDVA